MRATGLSFAVLAGISVASAVIAQVLYPAIFGLLSTGGVLSSLLGATFLSIAALRTGVLSKNVALLLLTNGLLTFPLIVTIVSILPSLPAYMVDELTFAISGAVWATVGYALLPQREESPVEPQTAAR